MLFAGLNVTHDPEPALRRSSVFSRVWRVGVAGVVYAFLYFLAGMFVVYSHDFAREYYRGVGGGAMNPLDLFAFQIGRGGVWALMALPLLASQSSSTWERSNALGAAFAVFVGALLLHENPLMPGQIRMLHLVEISVSNFLFGLVVGYLLTRLVRR